MGVLLRALLFALLVALVASCAAAPGPRPTSPSPSAATLDAATSAKAEVLPFVHDDYPRALSEAKRLGKPLFVDAWAPWCHSCLSMREFVLTDRALAPIANDFVWLSIDTEKDDNAAFVARFPNRVWPTLWVLDAAREAPTLVWEGTATAPELITLLGSSRTGDAFLRANQAAARGDLAEAERGYRAVLASAGDRERPRAVEALVGLMSSRHGYAACAELASRAGPGLPSGTSRATVIVIGLSCAREGKLADEAKLLSEIAERLAVDSDPRTSADDRSALFEELCETKKASGDEAGARVTARAWAAFLEGEASRAPTKEARAVFDAHRLGAYLAAAEPARAIPMLVASERDFPTDYNPPARLARAYLTMNALEDARAAIDRAGARVYGPRTLRVFALAADIAKARADLAGERAALDQALVRTSQAVLNDRQKKLRADLEARRAALRP